MFRVLLFLFITNISYADISLQPGDMLFQDLNCGEFCDGINQSTVGYHNTAVSHVAVVIDAVDGKYNIIQANGQGVNILSLDKFLHRSLDESGNPRVMVGRLNQYREFIPAALFHMKLQLHKPYNYTFIDNSGESFYCSELIYKGFNNAASSTIFPYLQMNFTNGISPDIFPYWITYYKNLHISVPEGFIGSNPGALSRESFVDIIYFYGKLRILNK